ncbi:MAG: pilus assembly protein CpaE, partial [Paracoccaceae bacterium]|nr:pilus assembly protein CpaE [Paracoccaceae bacterium]
MDAYLRNIRVILIAEDVSPAALHQLLRQGADEFVPYPLPENELASAIDRIRMPEPAPVLAAPETAATARKSSHDREGVVLAQRAG